MKITDIEKRKTLGNILKEHRTKNNYTFREVFQKTDIDVSTISQLEDGNIMRINALALISLARLYKINPLIYFKIVDYIDNQEVLEYCKIIKREEIFLTNNSIEIFDMKSIFSKENYFKRYIELPFLTKNKVYNAFETDNFIFVYNFKEKELKERDLGIFSINNVIFIAYYYFKKDIISLKDYFTKDVQILTNKDKFNILGKVITIIDHNFDIKEEL